MAAQNLQSSTKLVDTGPLGEQSRPSINTVIRFHRYAHPSQPVLKCDFQRGKVIAATVVV